MHLDASKDAWYVELMLAVARGSGENGDCGGGNGGVGFFEILSATRNGLFFKPSPMRKGTAGGDGGWVCWRLDTRGGLSLFADRGAGDDEAGSFMARLLLLLLDRARLTRSW